MVNTIVTNEVEKKKEEAAEFLELYKKVPENRKQRVLGLLEGMTIMGEPEQKRA